MIVSDPFEKFSKEIDLMSGVILKVNSAKMFGAVLPNGNAAAAAKAELFADGRFNPTAIVTEPVPPPVDSDKLDSPPAANGGKADKREIVLGRNMHTTSLEVTEPDADNESTGDKEAYMASVLARYRKTLVERTKYHLGAYCCAFDF